MRSRLIVPLTLITILLTIPACSSANGSSEVGCKNNTAAPATMVPAEQTTASGPMSTKATDKPASFLAKRSPRHLRIVSYNVNWDAIFPDNDPLNHKFRSECRPEQFIRVVKALQPDILCIQEINDRRDPQQLATMMDKAVPLPNGRKWQAHNGRDNFILSRFDLSMKAADTTPQTNRGQAMALVDLPDSTYKQDIYLINAHFKAAGGEKNIKRRQKHADAIIHWIGDIKTPGGKIDLPKGTPIVILGDLNVYKTDLAYHVTTLVSGDIVFEDIYGQDLHPDWDNTDMTDALPLHNAKGPDRYTWRDDTGNFEPGPLDRVIFTDSVMSIAHSFVLNTATMTDAELTASGLQRGDVTLNLKTGHFDHLPVVVDFVVK